MDWQTLTSFSGAVFAIAIAFTAACFWERSIAMLSFVSGMTLLAVESGMVGMALNSVLPAEVVFWEKRILLINAIFPGVWLIFSLAFSRGCVGAFPAIQRAMLIAAAVLPGSIVLLLSFYPAIFGISASGDEFRLVTSAVSAWTLIVSILILLNLERTIRAAVGTIRWRIKFVLLAIGILFVTRCYTASQSLLFSSISIGLQSVNSGALVISSTLLSFGLVRMGTKAQVTVYPSQSVLRGSITFLLAGAYLLAVGLLARGIDYFGGAKSLQVKALFIISALLLLGVALLSDKLRQKVRYFVSNHFSRPLHDYRSVWSRFTQSTGACATPQQLCRAVAELGSELFQALSVHVWIFDEDKCSARKVASTASSAADSSNAILSRAEVEDIAAGLAKVRSPIDLSRTADSWTRALGRVDFEVFAAGGNRICCPIFSGHELLGWITLGDRVSGVRFGTQDLELLHILAEQAGASLLRLQVTEKLAQARQLEAFQAMSAFFVHDLKNTASVLTLTLKNFPLHYQDSAFREDALRGMAKTVDHVNSLIDRLGALRHQLTMRTVECDLNDLVNATLKKQPHPNISAHLGSLPRIHVDPEAMDKVLSNLLLNAREASDKDETIEVTTSKRNGWVVLQVKDKGCGMAADFIRDSLFRPFRSTKKRGLGIGMFHCKMIVEAHRGRIEVQSAPGEGTCFQVLLPANPNS